VAGRGDRPTAVVIQADGKILVGGNSGENTAGSTGVLIRYNPDGSLDTTFGNGGEEMGLGLATVTGLALDGNEIVVGGIPFDDSGITGFVVDLLKADGSTDTAFGQYGETVANFSPYSQDETDAVAVGNGLIYAGGATLAPGAPYKVFAVVAFSPTGAVAAQATVNFNNGGDASEAWALAIQPSDGKVIAAGFDQVGTNHVVELGALARFNPDLTQDTSFGNNGLVPPDLGPGSHEPVSLVVQANGDIVTLTDAFEVVRYHPNGSLDNTFGTNGVAMFPLQGNNIFGQATGLALEADGNLVAVGQFTSQASFEAVTAARYIGSSTDTHPPAPPPVTPNTPDPSSSGSTSVSTQVSPPAPAIPVDGPHVTSVTRYGQSARRTTLVIRFDTAMSAASADNLSSYTITGRRGHVTKVVKASYNSATSSVTIRPARGLSVHRSYVLTVSGTGPFGLESASGTRLDGLSNGKPGSNYVTGLTARHRHVLGPRSL